MVADLGLAEQVGRSADLEAGPGGQTLAAPSHRCGPETDTERRAGIEHRVAADERAIAITERPTGRQRRRLADHAMALDRDVVAEDDVVADDRDGSIVTFEPIVADGDTWASG